MHADPDVLIIGGGVAGLFCAHHLRRYGGSVTVLERGTVGGADSCSHGNTGFVGTHGAARLAGPGMLAQGLRGMLNPAAAVAIRPHRDGELLRWLWHFRRACHDRGAQASLDVLTVMKQQSLEMLRELCAPAGLAATFAAPGMVIAFKTPRAYEQACRTVPRAVARGIPLRAVDRAELAELEPDTEFDIHAALYNGEGAFLKAPGFIAEFARTLADAGVEIHQQADVTGFSVSGGTVGQVRTTRGTFRPAAIVIAAGAWSAQCARKLGVRLTLQPVKGYSITVRAPRTGPRLPVLLAEEKVAVSPLGDRVRFAGILEISGRSRATSPGRVDRLRRSVRAYLPGLAGTETMEVWSGLRPCTPDSLPLLGRAEPHRNVFIAAGYGQMGMGLAPAAGKLIAQAIAGQQPDLDLAPFRVDRFRRRAVSDRARPGDVRGSPRGD